MRTCVRSNSQGDKRIGRIMTYRSTTSRPRLPVHALQDHRRGGPVGSGSVLTRARRGKGALDQSASWTARRRSRRRSAVVVWSRWPIHSWIARSGAPAAAIRVPKVCRRPWKVTRRTPARRGCVEALRSFERVVGVAGQRVAEDEVVVALVRRAAEVALELGGDRSASGTARVERSSSGVLNPPRDSCGGRARARPPSRRRASAARAARPGAGRSSPRSGRARVGRAEQVVGHGAQERLELLGSRKRMSGSAPAAAGGRRACTGLVGGQRRRTAWAKTPCRKVRWLVIDWCASPSALRGDVAGDVRAADPLERAAAEERREVARTMMR